jgi:hypothetical protein
MRQAKAASRMPRVYQLGMDVKLDSTEIADVREALQSFTKVLLAELAKADQRQYRAMLRQKVRRYEALLLLFPPPEPDRHAA